MAYYNNLVSIKKKKEKLLNFFWLGFFIYTLSNALSSTGHIDIKICQALQIPGLLLVLFGLFSLLKFKFDNYYLGILFVLYFLWFLGIMFRDTSLYSNYAFLKRFFFDTSIGPLYLAPLLVLFPKNFIFYKKLFYVIFLFGIFYIIYNLVFIKDLIHANVNPYSKAMVEVFAELSFPSGFVLLTIGYHSSKRQLLAVGVIALTILLAVIHARRGLLFMCTSMVLVSFILQTLYSKKKLQIIYVTVITMLLAAFYIGSVYKPKNNKVFGSLVQRGSEDTRTNVELYFYADMKPNDWIAGRGIYGEYFCPDIEENQVTNYRTTIETGYLQTILNGGLISLGLFVLIAVPAIILGLFFSKNILSKAAGFWVLMALINSYPTVFNGFVLKYLLVWISIGICYSSTIRNLKDGDVKKFLQTD